MELIKALEIFNADKSNRKELEILLSLKLSDIALDRSYYLYNEEFKTFCKTFIKKNLSLCQKYNISLYAIQHIKDFNLIENEHMDIIIDAVNNYYSVRKEDLFYCINKNISYSQYRHYMDVITELKVDIQDEYWKHPNNFNKMLDKAEKQLNEIHRINDLELQKKYKKIVEKYIKNNPYKKIDGYEIFIPETIEEIRKQAEVLNQCLMRCNYPQKIIDTDCILIFMQKDGKPVATCELDRNDKIIKQFHQDQKDYSQCQATEEQKIAMKKYLDNWKKAA